MPPSSPIPPGATSEAHLAASSNKAWQGLAGVVGQPTRGGRRALPRLYGSSCSGSDVHDSLWRLRLSSSSSPSLLQPRRNRKRRNSGMCSEHCCKPSQALCVCSLRLSAAQEVASVISCVVLMCITWVLLTFPYVFNSISLFHLVACCSLPLLSVWDSWFWPTIFCPLPNKLWSQPAASAVASTHTLSAGQQITLHTHGDADRTSTEIHATQI